MGMIERMADLYEWPMRAQREYRVPRWMRRFWRGVREWCGDAAYERYLLSRTHSGSTHGLPTAAEFYVEQLERRYSRLNRCC
jgi:uncharacterized short protein YbdD (DUF466 family)